MYLKRNTKSARPAPPAVSRAGASVFALLARKTKYMDPALADHWPTLAGSALADLSRPGRITGSRQSGGKSLELHVPNGAAAAQVQMQTDELLKRINAYLGPDAVARINIIQSGGSDGAGAAGSGARSPQNPAPTADDGPLGAALASFRAAINRRGDKKDG